MIIDEIKTAKIPHNWKIVQFEEVLELVKNGISKKQNKEGKGKAVSRIETISMGVVNYKKVGYLENLSNEDIEKYKLQYGDILFSNINSDYHLGKTAIFTNQKLLLHGMNLLLLRLNKDLISFHYLNFIFQYYRNSGVFISIAQHAVNQSSINQTKLKNLPILFPPLNEQHRIVEKIEELFTKLDAAVTELKNVKKQLKRYRQSVLKAAFEGKLTEEWRKENNIYFDHWSSDPLSVTSKINPPKMKLENENTMVSFLPMKNVEEITGKFDPSLIKKYSEVKKGYTSFIDGDVIFAKITPCMENGKIAVLESLKNGIGFGSTEFHVLRCGEKLSNYYLFYFLVRDSYRGSAKQQMTGAVGQKRVQKKFLEQTIIPIPKIEEQNKIVEEIESRLSVTDKIEEEIDSNLKKTEQLRQSILKRAFEGKLVPQDPNDPPASELLKQIKKGKKKKK